MFNCRSSPNVRFGKIKIQHTLNFYFVITSSHKYFYEAAMVFIQSYLHQMNLMTYECDNKYFWNIQVLLQGWNWYSNKQRYANGYYISSVNHGKWWIVQHLTHYTTQKKKK